MSHTATKQRALDAARAAHEGARAATMRLLTERAEAAVTLAEGTRTLGAGHPELGRLARALDDVDTRLVAARVAQRQAKAAVMTALKGWLGQTIAADVAVMTSELPVVLLPVRLETRFHPIGAPTVLRVRLYPDAIMGDSHEPSLTGFERAAGEAYWWEAWTPANEAKAWSRLLGSLPAPRAAWVVHSLEPFNVASRPAGSPVFPLVDLRPASWTRAVEARLLPDRWIVRGYRLDPGGALREVASAESLPIADALALTLSPNPDADADQTLSDDLLVDEDAAWAFSFGAALDAGMAVELPLPAIAPTAGFDRLLAVGVKASLPPEQAVDRLGELLDAHHFARGLAFVPQGTPTNNTTGGASGFPPPDPGGVVSFDVERGAPIGKRESDGEHWVRALGLTGDQLDLHIGGIDRRDGRATEQRAARAMNEALWPATLGYFLEQAMAPVFSAATIEEARRYFVDHVRGRGPYPAFRVGSTPYGLLPVSSLDRWAPLTQATSLLTLTLSVRRRRWATAPALCCAGPVLFAFANDPSAGLHHRVLGDPRSDWEPLDGEILSSPAVASPAEGRIDLVARSADDLLLHRTQRRRDGRGSGWSDWEVLAGGFVGDPALCSWDAERLDAFAVDGDGGLLHRFTDGGRWSEWAALGGEPVRDPAAASLGEGRIDVVARNTADELVHRSFRLDAGGGTWSAWETVVAGVAGRPAIAAPYEGRLEVVVSRTDGYLAHLSFTDGGPENSWSAAEVIDGHPAALPALVAPSPHGLELLALDTEGRLLRRSLRSRGRLGKRSWSAWSLVDPDVRRADYRVGRRVAADGQAGGGWRGGPQLLEAVAPETVAASIAAGDVTGSGRPDLIVLRLDHTAGDVQGSYRVHFDVDAFGMPTGGVTAALPLPDPLGPGALGAAVALVDVTGTGALDLVVLVVDAATGLRYRVGFELDANGVVGSGWGPWQPVPGGPGTAIAGAVAVADIDGDGRPDLVAFHAVAGGAGNDGFYRVGRSLDASGAVTGGWTPPMKVPDGFGPSARAFAIAVADLDRNGRPDLVVSWTDEAASGRQARLRVGAELDVGGQAAGWIAPLELPGDGVGTPASHSIVAADLDARPVVGDRVAGMLRMLRREWLRGIADVPRVGGTSDPDADLLGVLGMDAGAREVRVRQVLGRELLFNAQRLLGLGYFGMTQPGRWSAWLGEQQAMLNRALCAIGPPAWDPSASAPLWNPRLGGMVADEQHPRFAHALVTLRTKDRDIPTSEERPLEPENYIEWLLAHGGQVADLRGNFGGIVGERPPLLALLLRHALLLEHVRIGLDLLDEGTGTRHDRRERELVGMPVIDAAGFPEVAPTIWDTFAAPPVAGEPPLQDQLAALWADSMAGEGPFLAHQAALAALRDLPTAELERLLTETLDVCSHRLDAWITSLAANRLDELRRAFRVGSHLAAFGWVEDLRPGTPDRYRTVTVGTRQLRVQKDSGGYVHAPSATHAAAAAVLRNAYLTRRGADHERYAVALSSARVRAARELLDTLRDGEKLGAVLGARVERGLHERSQAAGATALEQFIEKLRDAFPLVAGKGHETAAPADPPSAAAARNVLDGLALRAAAHRAGDLDLSAIAQGAPAPVVAALRSALEGEVAGLDELLDATADLLTAEGVYQLIQGNPAAAAASLDALAQGVRPPDPAIASTPHGGTALTHRFAVVLGEPATAVGADWPAVATPRAKACPELDGWAASVLGDPHRVRCRTRATNPDGTTVTKDVSLHDLGIRAVDVLALARTSQAGEPASELDRRVAWVVAGTADEGAEIRIVYAADPAWDRATTLSFPEAFALAQALDAVVGAARPLRPEDMLRPELASGVPDTVWRGDDALARARDAKDELVAVEGILGPVVDKVRKSGPGSLTAADIDAVRGGLVRSSDLGIAGAFPARRKGGTDDVRNELSDQAASVHRELKRRTEQAAALEQELAAIKAPVSQADKARYATELAHAVLGRDAAFLVGFEPSTSDELGTALGAGSTIVGPTPAVHANALRAWLQRAARVRPPLARWRKFALYAETLGAVPALDVAQLPFQPGERWVGLPLANAKPASGRVSLVMHRVVAPPATSAWSGLLVDEWSEIIPNASEMTGVTYHYDDPRAQAAQAVLIAVPPGGKATWDLETLTDVLHETLDLAKLRAVDLELVGGLGQLLPATLVAANHVRDTVSVDFRHMRVGD